MPKYAGHNYNLMQLRWLLDNEHNCTIPTHYVSFEIYILSAMPWKIPEVFPSDDATLRPLSWQHPRARTSWSESRSKVATRLANATSRSCETRKHSSKFNHVLNLVDICGYIYILILVENIDVCIYTYVNYNIYYIYVLYQVLKAWWRGCREEEDLTWVVVHVHWPVF